MFVARSISGAKWRERDELGMGEIPADAVTADLRTKGNALSFWRCGDGGPEEVKRVALAIGSAAERIDKVEVVWLADEELRADGQTLRDSPGRTPVTELIDSHVDVTRLDLSRLARLAHRVVEAIGAGRHLRLRRGELKVLLVDALEQNRVNVDEMGSRVRQELGQG